MASKWQNEGGAQPGMGEQAPSNAPVTGGVRRSVLFWSGIGFIAGSLFWSVASGNSPLHLALHLNAPPQHTSSISKMEKLPSRLSDAVRDGPGCIALILDRSGQQTRADDCPGEESLLEHLAGSGRQDRLPAATP